MTTAPARTPARTTLVCNCQRTMAVDGALLAKAVGSAKPLAVHSELCRGGIAAFESALATGGPLHVACTQEAPLFREVATEKGFAESPLTFTNIRETAGWCADSKASAPKMAALLADGLFTPVPTGLRTLTSSGQCLVYGRGQSALDAARALAGRLTVTLLLADDADIVPPRLADFAIVKGRIKRLAGHLGKFELEIDGYAAMLPSSRGAAAFALPRDGARSTCDLVLDLSGGAALLSDHRREGYLRADPADPAGVARQMLAATDLVGEFEKPLYVAYDAGICAHARSQKIGCTKCLDACPTGAIASDGDHVAIDANVCAGCGTCSAVCPTGAVSYAYPARGDLVGRVQAMLGAYAKAGGKAPVLLVHDDSHGAPLIDAMARTGRGLPVNVIPLAVYAVTALGHDLMAAALAAGASEIVLLAAPEHPVELAALETEIALLAAFLDGLGHAGPRVRLLTERDPDSVEASLHDRAPLAAIDAGAFVATGSKREIARLALAKLHAAAPRPVDGLALPAGAPYGRIVVQTDGCTLCLSCVGACPANALADNPDRPQLSFTEAACVQCGICVATCPEQVISLEPRYDFTDAAHRPLVIKDEEPALCVRCGTPFGAKATIKRIVAQLKGRHAMFATDAQARLIEMCDTCRITELAESGNDPFKSAARPRIRTTDDYVADAAAVAAGKKTPDDFLS